MAETEAAAVPKKRRAHGTQAGFEESGFGITRTLMNVNAPSPQVPLPQVVVGAIVIHDGRLLMVRRANDPSKGLWTVPGGRVNPGEYLADAARREVLEETGVTVEVGELLGVLEVVGEEWHYVIHDYLATVAGGADVIAADDAEEARWVPLREVRRLECTPRFVETLTGWGVLNEEED